MSHTPHLEEVPAAAVVPAVAAVAHIVAVCACIAYVASDRRRAAPAVHRRCGRWTA